MSVEEEESCLLRVGYALPARKIEAFMVPEFINYAKQKGIHFIPIDISNPLIDQGPFDCIIHKLYDHQWNLNLHQFTINHPNATVIDPPAAITRLHNRISMLEPISQLAIPHLTIPNQILIPDSISLKSLTAINDLSFPVIAKPLLANGSSNAHDMSLVFNLEGLTNGFEFEPPMVLQEFVNHGGIIFKVYVAGDYVKCVKRSSLPDVSMDEMGSECGGVMKFSQISSGVKLISGDGDDDDGEKVKMPAPEFVVAVAEGLRSALGLHLFNFDMIKDDKRDEYLVIDINYFPGYEKLPSFETVMTEFFLNIKESQNKKMMTTAMVDEELQVLKV